MAQQTELDGAAMTGLGRASIIGITRGSNPCRGGSCSSSQSLLSDGFHYAYLRDFSWSHPVDQSPQQGLEPTSESSSTSVRNAEVRNADRHPSESAGDHAPSGQINTAASGRSALMTTNWCVIRICFYPRARAIGELVGRGLRDASMISAARSRPFAD